MFRAPCAHHQEVKIVLYSIWYHLTCRWPSGAQVERRISSVSKISTFIIIIIIIIIIIPIIIIIIIISFMQGIYTYIPETNYVPKEYSVAAILLFLFMVLISLVSVLNLLYFYISTFRIMCAVPNMAVFGSSLTSWFPGTLLTYFLNVFEIVPVAPIITGITFFFTYHMRCISIYYYYYIIVMFIVT